MILKNGEVGYSTKIPEGDFNYTVIDTMKISKNDSPRFLHLNFLTGVYDPKYVIKSLGYSMISTIEFEKLLEILKNSACDHENFCQIRDKSKHIPDEYEVLNCELCEGKHSKMSCPKVHYIPIEQFVIFGHL